MKTSELEGEALALAVAKAMGFPDGIPTSLLGVEVSGWGHRANEWRPDVRWDQGGLIIEMEGICLRRGHSGWWIANTLDVNDDEHFMSIAPTPLIAAMRAFVASKMGDGPI